MLSLNSIIPLAGKTPVAGKSAYTNYLASASLNDTEAYEFLRGYCIGTDFEREDNIYSL